MPEEPEVVKNEIVKKLVDIQDTLKHAIHPMFCLSKDFIRGFIWGAENQRSIDFPSPFEDVALPSHVWDEIEEAVKAACPKKE